MKVSLTPQLEIYVKQKVASGMYNSVSEVMREALRLLEERDVLKSIKLDALRRDVQDGLNELNEGLATPLDMDVIKAKARALKTSEFNA